VNNSCITANVNSGLYANEGTTNATNNWWGAANGPAGNGTGAGNAVLGSNNITFTPFQTAAIACGVGTVVGPTPTPTAPPTAAFKIRIISDGTRPWSPNFEIASINQGVLQVGQAFDLLSVTTNTPVDAFNLVMLEGSGTEILFIRTQGTGATITINNYQYQYGTQAGGSATLTYTNAPQGYCISWQERLVGTVRNPAAIICNGDLIDQYSGTTLTLEASQYTVVHELGHLFDYRTGSGLRIPIGSRTVPLEDCTSPPNTGIITGPTSSAWIRGRRGWGTGPAQYLNSNGNVAPVVTDFQQNTENSDIEAAADSFLNWVYRVNTSQVQAVYPCSLTPLPPSTQWTGPGFLNQAWSATPHPSFIPDSAGIAGTPDPSLPGDVRHYDMDVLMRQIFSTNSW
jgi:hypothetical protein